MKTVGILSFHAAYNYGSMLQAFALQWLLKTMDYNCEHINLQLDVQKQGYSLNSFVTAKGWKSYIDRLILQFHKHSLQQKRVLFNRFLHESLTLSMEEYTNEEDLRSRLPEYDFYLVGSDQIWNTSCFDFSWSYYLPFSTKGKKIAYAPSMGPSGTVAVRDEKKVRDLLLNFDAISVREEASADTIKRLLNQSVPVTLDPTLLLSSQDWKHYIDAEPLVQGDYLFLYTPFPVQETYAIAHYLAKKLKLKVVVSLYNAQFIIQYPYFRTELAVGPWEFLNLIKNARITCCGSFHAVVFSILFKIPFFAVNGDSDQRMMNLLKLTHFENRSISYLNRKEQIIHAFDIDFTQSEQFIANERLKSIDFMTQALMTR